MSNFGLIIWKTLQSTGKSFSEALILALVNPQHDEILFIESPEKYKFRTCCVHIVLNVKTIKQLLYTTWSKLVFFGGIQWKILRFTCISIKLTRSIATGHWRSSNVTSKFQDSSLAIRPWGDHENIFRVFNGSNGSGSQHKFFPSFFHKCFWISTDFL